MLKLGSDPQTVRERHRILEMQYAAAASVAVRHVDTVGELVMHFYESNAWIDMSANTKAHWRFSSCGDHKKSGTRLQGENGRNGRWPSHDTKSRRRVAASVELGNRRSWVSDVKVKAS